MSTDPTVTGLLHAVNAGDRRAAAELLPILYEELRRLARARMSNLPPGNTLQPTALVHEAFARLVGDGGPVWANRGHFFAAAGEAMRQVMVDQARAKAALKRGGGRRRLALDDDATNGPDSALPALRPFFDNPSEDLLDLNEALIRLEQYDPRKAQLVHSRYFAGLSADETALALGVSLGTIERDWRYIRARLRRELSDASSRLDATGDSPL